MTHWNWIGMLGRCALVAWIVTVAGCASITNPVANGVPAHLLPDQLLAESVEALEPVPLDWLRVKPPEVYRLDTGDIIGVYIEGALGDRDQLPPINFPQVADVPPSIGFPIPIGEEGTVPLPLVKKVKVVGMTLEEAQEAITQAYLGQNEWDKQFLQPDEARILVTLVRPRQARILVIREDAPYTRPSVNDATFRLFGSAPSLGVKAQGSGQILELPEAEADVLSTLAQTGGLPGPTAAYEIIIYRGFTQVDGLSVPQNWSASRRSAGPPRTITIPLRIKPGQQRPFTEEDIHLQSGDIVFVPPRQTDVYYTGGLLPAREVPLPRDNDLRVVEAILRVGGSVVSGGAIVGNFSATGAFLTGIENSNPSLLTVIRRLPNDAGQVVIRVDLNRALRDSRENLLVMPGDVLVLQETPAEAVSRYWTTVLQVGIFSEAFRRGSATAQASATVP
jgi:protein involved in polysaccharide export with SLBB domain